MPDSMSHFALKLSDAAEKLARLMGVFKVMILLVLFEYDPFGESVKEDGADEKVDEVICQPLVVQLANEFKLSENTMLDEPYVLVMVSVIEKEPLLMVSANANSWLSFIAEFKSNEIESLMVSKILILLYVLVLPTEAMFVMGLMLTEKLPPLDRPKRFTLK